eukprot:GDKK01019145.1.p2 GENE.GDKK01019145.1~~GDKK01019145.1.p2  ORF type:complete len:105 (-),score=23.98 GDKK01019145.1:18-332(-)
MSLKRQLEDEKSKSEELQKAVEVAANETARTVRDKLRDVEASLLKMTIRAEAAESLVEHHRAANSVLLARMETCIAEHSSLSTGDDHWNGLLGAAEVLQRAGLS